jgi:phosphate transport system permease protein
MTATASAPARSAQPSDLVGARLPTGAPLMAAAVGIVLALALKFLLGWTGWLTAFFSAALLFVIALSVWSFSVEGRRRAKDRFASTLIYSCFVAAMVPLVLILGYIVVKGAPAFSLDFFTHSMNGVNARTPGGGIYAAILGTLEQVGIAAVIAIPIGLFTAIYLVEYGKGGFARAVTFFVDVMTGVPSIVAGLFVYSFLLLGTGLRPFGAAGSIALIILMIPVIVRSSEEMLRLVPRDLRDASYALGVPRWRTILKIVLPTALSGLITSCLLAIARVAGETAPLILLVGYAGKINGNPFSGDQATLPMFIWDQLGKRTGNSGPYTEPRAWGAALALVVIILLLNVIARLLARAARPKTR